MRGTRTFGNARTAGNSLVKAQSLLSIVAAFSFAHGLDLSVVAQTRGSSRRLAALFLFLLELLAQVDRASACRFDLGGVRSVVGFGGLGYRFVVACLRCRRFLCSRLRCRLGVDEFLLLKAPSTYTQSTQTN